MAAISQSFNILLNTVIGIFLLKDDPQIGRIYRFLVTTCCQMCGDACPGGMPCLMSFMICNLITVVFALLGGNVQACVAAYKQMANSVVFFDAFVFFLYLVSLAGSLISQTVGCIYACKAYNEMQAMSDLSQGFSGGGGFGGGGMVNPAARDRDDAPARESQPARGFVPFQGGGQTLGS
eukprot:TRINITY_DN67662_c0_g1_i1.p1 TRINITY_DN67662_c0_g1~~TRINITY_DN67662_c0_g1_i1.p1  ORF type:complete len:209 (-),score=22.76 TRINITY_DN67662_c0_g1_i1:40-576(-)